MAKAAGYIMPADQVARMADLRRSIRKARKIRRVLEEELGPAPWPRLRVLDLGCGPGTIAAYFARLTARVTAVDVDAETVERARARFRSPKLDFITLADPRLPFADGSFDLLIVNHVYEHVGEQNVFFAEVRRVLAPSGLAYLAAAGRWQVIEPHYGLPFLSWLPPALANAYLKASGRREAYDVHLLSFPRLFRLLKSFARTEYTARIIAEPRRFAATDVVGAGGFRRRAAAFVARRFPALIPTRIFVLRPR
jgi:SAM-dependent methyltransferase